jgi:tetratricopeptide (TPR) repeat protein
MKPFSQAMRNRLPALGLGVMAALGMTGAAAVMAPAAVAQEGGSLPAFGNPAKEAQAAIKAKNWPLATQKIDQAAPNAKSGQERYIIDAMRYQVAAGKGDKAAQIKTAETLIANPNAPASMKSTLRDALPGLYDQTGQSAKAVAMVKERVGEGGGSLRDNLYLASAASKARNWNEAIKYGNRALSLSGSKPPESTFKLVMLAYYNANQHDKYYEVMEKAVVVHPKNAEYWKQLANRAQKSPKWSSDAGKLDLQRFMLTANVPMDAKARLDMARTAMYRQLPAEAVSTLTPAPAGADGTTTNEIKQVSADAAAKTAQQKAALAAAEKEAVTNGRGPEVSRIAEQHLTFGNHPKAIELFNTALTKGFTDPGQADFVRLRLGIAQFRSGKKEDARKTWDSIKADNGSAVLARTWSLFSKT